MAVNIENGWQRIVTELTVGLQKFGITFPEAAERLKDAFVEAAREAGGETSNLSRLSVITGLQRKDLKKILSRLDERSEPSDSVGLMPKIVARWRGRERFRTQKGEPAELPRRGEGSFAELVADITTDVHHRAVLDEMLRLGMIEFDRSTDRVRLIASAALPQGELNQALVYWRDNLADHAAAATANIADCNTPPFFERATHYGGLSRASIEELQDLARNEFDRALQTINARAMALQEADRAKVECRWRFRAGGYIYFKPGPKL